MCLVHVFLYLMRSLTQNAPLFTIPDQYLVSEKGRHDIRNSLERRKPKLRFSKVKQTFPDICLHKNPISSPSAGHGGKWTRGKTSDRNDAAKDSHPSNWTRGLERSHQPETRLGDEPRRRHALDGACAQPARSSSHVGSI